MADKNLLGQPPPSLSSPSHQSDRIGGAAAKCSPPPHRNGTLGAGPQSSPQPHSAPGNRTSASPLRTLGALMTPGPGPGPEGGSVRPRGLSLGSALRSRTRTMNPRNKQEEPEALLDLILECQGQRLDDQRASLSLLPDPGPAALCGACSPDQPTLPNLDFYYMLIHYQSDRMEDQRCSLPDLDDVISPVPEGQEDFFSLVQRVQSRRMDEQRALLLLTHAEDDTHVNTHTAASHHHHHHPH